MRLPSECDRAPYLDSVADFYGTRDLDCMSDGEGNEIIDLARHEKYPE